MRGLLKSSSGGNDIVVSWASKYMSPLCHRHTCYAVGNTVRLSHEVILSTPERWILENVVMLSGIMTLGVDRVVLFFLRLDSVLWLWRIVRARKLMPPRQRVG